jgi:hypothetical protein
MPTAGQFQSSPDVCTRSFELRFDRIVMPALVAGIHVLNPIGNKDVDGRNKSE